MESPLRQLQGLPDNFLHQTSLHQNFSKNIHAQQTQIGDFLSIAEA